MPQLLKGTGYTTGDGRECLTTDDAAAIKQGKGRLITAPGVDAAGDYYSLAVEVGTGRLILAGYTALTQSTRTEEIDPISQHYVGQTLADVTDQPDLTYYYYLDFAGYKHLGLQLALDCGLGTVTATVEASLQDDGSAPAACAYIDVTNAWFGVASLVSAAAPAAAYWDQENLAVKYVRVVIVANTGGAGAQLGDWAIYSKQLY